MNVNPFSLPFVEFSRTNSLPQKSGVYFVIRGNEILYIGKSSNIKKRWVSHVLKNTLRNNNAERISWLENATGENEIEFIKHFEPAFNKSGLHRSEKCQIRQHDLFVAKLDKALQERHMTRADLAKKSRVSQSFLSLVYNGSRNASADVCISIASALNLSVMNVLSWAGIIDAQENELVNEMREVFERLSSDDQLRLIAIGKTLSQLYQETQP